VLARSGTSSGAGHLRQRCHRAGDRDLLPFHAGVSIVQIMFCRVTAAALGVLALPPTAGGRRLRRAGAVIALAGWRRRAGSLALASTARQTAQGHCHSRPGRARPATG